MSDQDYLYFLQMIRVASVNSKHYWNNMWTAVVEVEIRLYERLYDNV